MHACVRCVRAPDGGPLTVIGNQTLTRTHQEVYPVAPRLDQLDGPGVGDALGRLSVDLHDLIAHLPEGTAPGVRDRTRRDRARTRSTAATPSTDARVFSPSIQRIIPKSQYTTTVLIQLGTLCLSGWLYMQ